MVTKQDGTQSEYKDEILKQYIENKVDGLNKQYMNVDIIIGKVAQGIYNGVTTTEISALAAETCAYMAIVHPDYTMLANRIAVTALHDRTFDDIREVADALYTLTDKVGRPAPLLADDVYKCICENADKINARLDYTRDFNYDFFGFKTLERGYLLKCDNKTVERPQHMLMRVSIGIHLYDLESAFETYDLMSNQWFTHATPTLFNAGT